MVSRIELRLKDKSEWVKIFDPRDFTVFVRMPDPPALGESLRIDLTVGDGGPRAILRGTVASRRDTVEDGLPVGCSLALGHQEREKVNYLNAFIRGGMLDKREKRRLPVRLEVSYGGVDGTCESYTRDINEEGIFVVTEEPLPENTTIHLRVTIPDRDRPLSLKGRVSHTVVIEDEDVPGMGIVFFDEVRSETLTEIIDELEKAFLSGSLPDEYLL